MRQELQLFLDGNTMNPDTCDRVPMSARQSKLVPDEKYPDSDPQRMRLNTSANEVLRLYRKGQAYLCYIASPYSDPDENVRITRYHEVVRASAWLYQNAVPNYTPIGHCHPTASMYKMPTGWEWWKAIDRRFIQRMSEVVVLTLDGWRDSTGVTGEIEMAEEFDLPVSYLPPILDSDLILR